MIQVYVDLINQDHSKQAYRQFFDLLLANDKEDQSLLFHCTAGKDRTGMGAVFLLSALSVPEETIRTDYLLTNQASAAFVTQSLAKLQQKNTEPVCVPKLSVITNGSSRLPRYRQTSD